MAVNYSRAFSLSPSGNWDGNDGAWSTFVIRVGTPAQLFRVVPSTNGLETWIPIADQCEKGMGWCGNARGVEPFNGASSGSFSGTPNVLETSTIDAGMTCTANRSPMCVNCVSINGQCTNGPCTGRHCCGDPPGDCNSPGCNGVSGICTGAYIGCPCVGIDYNAPMSTSSNAGILNAAAASGFQSNLSSTWSAKGQVQLQQENYLGYTASGQFGVDTVGLGIDDTTGLTLSESVVAGIVTEPFYIGTLGMKPSNFTSLNDSSATLLTQLRQKNMIPSLSYGYTAGALYRQPPVLGSLTLGGFDSARLSPRPATFRLAGNDSQSLFASIETITASATLLGNVTVLSDSINALIDTALPSMWLPLSACQVFEDAFGLTWNESASVYEVNDTAHQQLLNKNPLTTFSFNTMSAGNLPVNITLPYSAFDLQASAPLFPNGTNYFPLRRASSPDQYTLGRVFLQEAYLTVDYEQGNFSIAQAQFPSSATPNLVTINHSKQLPLSNVSTTISHHHTLRAGAIVGICISSVIALVIIGVCVFLCLKTRHSGRRNRSSDPNRASITSKSSDMEKSSWPSSPSKSNALAPYYSKPELPINSPRLQPVEPTSPSPSTSLGSPAERREDSTCELEDLESPVVTMSTTASPPKIARNLPPKSEKEHQELPGSSTAKELPPTPPEKERMIFELAASQAQCSQ